MPFLVKKGFFGCFGGFSAPSGSQESMTSSKSPGKPPNLARFLGNPWHHMAPRHHILGTTAPHIWAPHIQANPTNPGTTDFGTSYSVPHTVPHIWYLILYLILYLIFGTSYLVPHTVPHTVPHIWHLIFGTLYSVPHTVPHIWHLILYLTIERTFIFINRKILKTWFDLDLV